MDEMMLSLLYKTVRTTSWYLKKRGAPVARHRYREDLSKGLSPSEDVEPKPKIGCNAISIAEYLYERLILGTRRGII